MVELVEGQLDGGWLGVLQEGNEGIQVVLKKPVQGLEVVGGVVVVLVEEHLGQLRGLLHKKLIMNYGEGWA